MKNGFLITLGGMCAVVQDPSYKSSRHKHVKSEHKVLKH